MKNKKEILKGIEKKIEEMFKRLRKKANDNLVYMKDKKNNQTTLFAYLGFIEDEVRGIIRRI